LIFVYGASRRSFKQLPAEPGNRKGDCQDTSPQTAAGRHRASGCGRKRIRARAKDAAVRDSRAGWALTFALTPLQSIAAARQILAARWKASPAAEKLFSVV